MKCRYSILLASVAFAAFLLGPSPASAQPPSTLGSAANFAVLGASTVTCAAGGQVTGSVGVSPGTSITGFTGTPALCTLTGGALHPGDGVAIQAQLDAAIAYRALSLQSCTYSFTGVTELAGLVLPGASVPQPLGPGVYCFESAAELNGTLELTGAGPWIFRMGSTLITGGTAPALVSVNGQPPNCGTLDLFWQVGSSATIGGVGTEFAGNILAFTSIGLVDGPILDGRALALGAAVTLDAGSTVSLCGTGGSTPPPFPPGCRVKVICHDYHDKNCKHHDKDGDRCDKDCDDHHDKGGKKNRHGR